MNYFLHFHISEIGMLLKIAVSPAAVVTWLSPSVCESHVPAVYIEVKCIVGVLSNCFKNVFKKILWGGDTGGRRYGDICICIADSLCYKAQTNTPL